MTRDAKNKKQYASVDEALSDLLKRPGPDPADPSVIPVPTDPWPHGDDVATEVLAHINDSLRRAVEHA
jgi:hypothetical protein